ncbi:DUF881 domain-containing protein [Halobacillus sp. BBL2006]|uniref:DUF881 domain-containing protein n=1 Tax=Halobacillus sp. BBL2006 TaxID=1543706 RepID=UPI0005442328|nr:DUF881 domain-containing protein [Halobacillus sp. BBL2006]KHE72294.1 hypothetical protein LD39_05320 [Halobacillus sp. BBL2006]
MKKQSKWMVSIICMFIGFMVAVQFHTTTSQTEVRDTRDEWEVREALKVQQEKQQELLTKLASVDETIESYEKKSSKEQVDTLKESIETLEEKVGLTEVKGDGVEITISPIFLENFSGEQIYPSISPQLLSRLLNELNTFGADEISIGNERLTSLSPIRNVNGSTYVNNRPLPPLPVRIQVLADNPGKLRDYINTSQSIDMFGIENLELAAKLKKNMTLPKFDDPLHLEKLEEIGE